MIIEITKRWKSCGQNGNPKILNRRSKTLNIRNWLPLILINGEAKRKISKP
jgi:hypothetical protein